MRELFTDRELDVLLRFTAGHSRRLAERGLIRAIRLPDGSLRFDARDIEEMLELCETHAAGRRVEEAD